MYTKPTEKMRQRSHPNLNKSRARLLRCVLRVPAVTRDAAHRPEQARFDAIKFRIIKCEKYSLVTHTHTATTTTHTQRWRLNSFDRSSTSRACAPDSEFVFARARAIIICMVRKRHGRRRRRVAVVASAATSDTHARADTRRMCGCTARRCAFNHLPPRGGCAGLNAHHSAHRRMI